MTTLAVHCYRLASRVSQGVLRAVHVRLPTAGAGMLLVAWLLAPVPVAVSMAAPLPILRTAPMEPRPAAPPPQPDDPIRAVVDALGHCAASLSRSERLAMARIIHRESREHGYDPLFITAMVQIESGCSRTARGGEALGLVQLLPSTARDVARRAGVHWRGAQTLTEPSANIAIGLRYLFELEEQLGDPYLAVAAYNLGPARVARMSTWRARQVRYVRKILSRYEQLRAAYA